MTDKKSNKRGLSEPTALSGGKLRAGLARSGKKTSKMSDTRVLSSDWRGETDTSNATRNERARDSASRTTARGFPFSLLR